MARREAGSLLEKRMMAVTLAGVLPYEWSVNKKYSNQVRVWEDGGRRDSDRWHVNHLRDAAIKSHDDRFFATWLAIERLLETTGDWSETVERYYECYDIDLRRLV